MISDLTSFIGYLDANNKCVCENWTHRVGDHCELCETGFTLNDKGECVRPLGCSPTSCSCGPLSTATHCDPIGVCSAAIEVGAPGKCACPSNFAGPSCNMCAPGFTRYPECVQDCDPPCINGRCDTTTKQCICDRNFMGPSCTECVPGHSGASCSIVNSVGVLKIVTMVVIGSFIVISFVVAAIMWRNKFIGSQDQLVLNDDVMLDTLGISFFFLSFLNK